MPRRAMGLPAMISRSSGRGVLGPHALQGSDQPSVQTCIVISIRPSRDSGDPKAHGLVPAVGRMGAEYGVHYRSVVHLIGIGWSPVRAFPVDDPPLTGDGPKIPRRQIAMHWPPVVRGSARFRDGSREPVAYLHADSFHG